MYHLKDDIRARRSAQMLYDGLMEVLKDKPFKKVSIADVSEASTVARATFYRNFDTVTDLLSWKCDSQFAEVLTKYVESNPDLEQEDGLLLYVLRYWMNDDNSQVLEVLMDIERIDIIYNSFLTNADILLDFYEKKGLYKKGPEADGAAEQDYFLSIRAGYLIGIIRAWIRQGKRQSPEEVTAIVRKYHEQVVESRVIF